MSGDLEVCLILFSQVRSGTTASTPGRRLLRHWIREFASISSEVPPDPRLPDSGSLHVGTVSLGRIVSQGILIGHLAVGCCCCFAGQDRLETFVAVEPVEGAVGGSLVEGYR